VFFLALMAFSTTEVSMGLAALVRRREPPAATPCEAFRLGRSRRERATLSPLAATTSAANGCQLPRVRPDSKRSSAGIPEFFDPGGSPRRGLGPGRRESASIGIGTANAQQRNRSIASLNREEIAMQVDMRPIGTIRPYHNNPRINDPAVDAVA